MAEPILMEDAVERLSLLLGKGDSKRELGEVVLRLFANRYIDLIQICLQPLQTNAALKRGPVMEATDTLLELMAAVAANDIDKALAIEHRLNS